MTLKEYISFQEEAQTVFVKLNNGPDPEEDLSDLMKKAGEVILNYHKLISELLEKKTIVDVIAN